MEEKADAANEPELVYLWRYFLNIADARKRYVVNGNLYPARITYQEILAWTTLSDIKLLPWEVQVIVEMDRLACAIEPTQTKNLENLVK